MWVWSKSKTIWCNKCYWAAYKNKERRWLRKRLLWLLYYSPSLIPAVFQHCTLLGFLYRFYCVSVNRAYITGVYRIPSRHQRDTTSCRQATQDSLAQCRLLASITHLYQLIIEIYPWSSFCRTPLNELILLTTTGRQFRSRGGSL